jgi:S1-C subfamily serine protease
MDELISYLSAKTEVGKTVTLTVLRNGDERQVEVTLQARPTTTRESRSVEIQPQPSSSRAFMGITAGSLTPAIAEAMDLPSDQTGVLVEQVEPGGPADDAGLRGSDSAATIDGQPVMIGGDVIVEIAGKPVASMEDLVTILQGYKPGDVITLAILRNGDPMDLELTLGERPG